MHTLAMAQNILQTALEEAEKHDGNKRIKAIGARISVGSFVEADSLQFCLEAEARGTPAEGARIKVEITHTDDPPRVILELD